MYVPLTCKCPVLGTLGKPLFFAFFPPFVFFASPFTPPTTGTTTPLPFAGLDGLLELYLLCLSATVWVQTMRGALTFATADAKGEGWTAARLTDEENMVCDSSGCLWRRVV